MAGIADRLFRLGKAKAGRATKDLPDLGALMSSLPSADRQALGRASKAAKRCRELLERDDAMPPGVSAELRAAVDGLMEQVQQLADRLAKARAWLRRPAPAQLAREAALAELDAPVGGASAGRPGSQHALAEQARVAAELEQGIAKLSYRLGTAARELESLEGRIVAPGAATAELSEGLDTQRARAERTLEDWAATTAEIRTL